MRGTLRRTGSSLGVLTVEVVTHEQREFLAGRRPLVSRGPIRTAERTTQVELEVYRAETTAGRETRIRHFVQGRPTERVTTVLKAVVTDAVGHAEQQKILARVRAMYPELDSQEAGSPRTTPVRP
ncbi:hypothetical protein [Deinococcus pimensis]|uniref:hypothetical protein n=1 Tax=Deinococcus pimensis TaxID=309888 RepID=UPI0012FBE867|nr:hypothetical protein [Deinococcus pimensis]